MPRILAKKRFLSKEHRVPICKVWAPDRPKGVRASQLEVRRRETWWQARRMTQMRATWVLRRCRSRLTLNCYPRGRNPQMPIRIVGKTQIEAMFQRPFSLIKVEVLLPPRRVLSDLRFWTRTALQSERKSQLIKRKQPGWIPSSNTDPVLSTSQKYLKSNRKRNQRMTIQRPTCPKLLDRARSNSPLLSLNWRHALRGLAAFMSKSQLLRRMKWKLSSARQNLRN